MSAELIFRLAGGVILLFTNAFFVASEFALTRLRQFKKEDLETDGRIDRAWKMTETLEFYLTGCQVGITFSSVLLGIVAEPAVTTLLLSLTDMVMINPATSHAISITIAVLLINMAHTVLAEQMPTYLGIEKANLVSKYSSVPLYWWSIAMYPFIYIGDKITKWFLGLFGIEIKRSWLDTSDKEEPTRGNLKSEMADLLKSGGMSKERQQEVLKAIEISDIPVREIMVPRDEIVSLTTQKSFRDNLVVLQEKMHARYPLIGDTLEDFKGILYTPEILANIQELIKEERELDDFDWPKLIVNEKMPVSELIDRFQEKHHELALVVNGNDEVVGLVTLTDALETIVGSVEDPLDLR